MNMKHPLPQTQGKRIQIQETEDYYVVTATYEEHVPVSQAKVFIPWTTIILFISLIAVVIWIWQQHTLATAESQPGSTVEESGSPYFCWKQTGFIFPDSRERYIGDGDIAVLSEFEGYSEAEVIRYAINEIYARHNYLFKTEKYLDFFSEYDWFSGCLSAEEAVKQFNSIEHKNIAFLLNVEANIAG